MKFLVNKRKILIYFFVLFILFYESVFANFSKIRVYFNGNSVPIKTCINKGDIYISVKDLTRVYPDSFLLDLSKKRLDILYQKPQDVNIDLKEDNINSGIIGEVLVKDKDGNEFPLRGVEVMLFKYNPSMSEDLSKASLKKWVKGEDNIYFETHGKVRESRTDNNGVFFISDIPSGKYELSLIYYKVKGKSGCFWRKVINVEKNRLYKLKFLSIESNNF